MAKIYKACRSLYFAPHSSTVERVAVEVRLTLYWVHKDDSVLVRASGLFAEPAMSRFDSGWGDRHLWHTQKTTFMLNQYRLFIMIVLVSTI